MKCIKLALIGIVCLSLNITSCAQQEDSALHLPQELDGIGQKMYGSFEYIYSRVSEYVKVADEISKADMDSVIRVAMSEYIPKTFGVNDSIFGKILSGSSIGGGGGTAKDSIRWKPEQQVLMDEIMSVIKKFNPKKGLSKLADELGKVNQKAVKTLSETDAIPIYAVSTMTYYSTKYWSSNFSKWQALTAEAKKKKENME
jgi:hypothetical protein